MSKEIEILMSEVKDGMLRIAIAYTGDKYKQGDKSFTITEQDLDSMAANMAERETPIDYEHMSAGAVPPGWSKAAGWIAAKAGTVEDFEDGRKVLWGWFEPTPACLASIKSKEYRYFSPEIHWAAKNEKGEPVGTKLAAGAITNRPFLKDLPPIDIAATDYPQLLEAVALSESKRLIDVHQIHVPTDLNKENKNMAVKTLKFKKLTEGEGKGKTGIFDEAGEMVGMCDKASMKSYMAEDAEPDDDDVKATEAKRIAGVHTACFTELASAKPGTVITMAERFVEEDKFDTKAFLRAQRIERLISESIAKGKVLPMQRQALFTMAVANYDSAAAFLADAKPVVDLRVIGIQGNETTMNPKQELDVQIATFREKNPTATYSAALREVSKLNPKLYEDAKNAQ